MEQFIPYLWLALIVIAAVVEGITVQLVSIWFVFGGIAALIANVCGADLWVQILLFIALSVVALLITRPFVKKRLNMKRTSTNADRYIGKKASVIVKINNTQGEGQVKVMGSIWTARSADGSVIPVGADVVVKAIEGVKLIVELESETEVS